jgi:GNAT superfamily N-acetyltransferase
MDPSIELRPVAPGDEQFLFELFRSREGEAFPPGLDAFLLRMQFIAQQREYEAAFPGSEHSIIVYEGNAAGRIWVSRSAQEHRIVDLALLPEYWRRGIGTALLEDLKAGAHRAQVPLRLAAQRGNMGAVNLYQKLGFTLSRDHGVHVELEILP